MTSQSEKQFYSKLVSTTIFIIGIGTIFYHFVEHMKWIDAYYFSVITLATVGYGDITPHTALGKIFTTVYIFIGVGIITTFISYTLKRRAKVKVTQHHLER